jgi:lauroyl/myristoyl acyltransferase
MGVKKRLIRLSTRTLVAAGRYIGPRRAVRVGCLIARHVGLDPRASKSQLRDNLRLFFPDRDARWVDETARAIQANALRARLFDKWFLPEQSLEELKRTCEWVNYHYLTDATRAGRGVIATSLHYGRYWAAPIWFSRHGMLASAFQSSVGRLPAEAETLSGGSFNANDPVAALRAVRALKKGEVLFLQLDAGKIQNPIAIDFLGHATRVSPAAVRLARAADAVILTGLTRAHPDDPERILLSFYAALDPREIPADESLEATMRRVLEPLEAQVRADPTQWYGALNAHRRLAKPDEF